MRILTGSIPIKTLVIQVRRAVSAPNVIMPCRPIDKARVHNSSALASASQGFINIYFSTLDDLLNNARTVKYGLINPMGNLLI